MGGRGRGRGRQVEGGDSGGDRKRRGADAGANARRVRVAGCPEPARGVRRASGAPGRRRTSSGGACPRRHRQCAVEALPVLVVQEAGDVPCRGATGKRTTRETVSCRRRRGDAGRGAEASARGGARGRPSPRKRARTGAAGEARGRARSSARGRGTRRVGGARRRWRRVRRRTLERRGSRVRRTASSTATTTAGPALAAPSCFAPSNIVAKRFEDESSPAPVSAFTGPERDASARGQRTLSGRKPRGRRLDRADLA